MGGKRGAAVTVPDSKRPAAAGAGRAAAMGEKTISVAYAVPAIPGRLPRRPFSLNAAALRGVRASRSRQPLAGVVNHLQHENLRGA